MTLPSHVFLDTSVLAGQQYNFGSATLTSFSDVAKEKGLRLVLPAPTSSEIERQIKFRSDEALKALDEARRKAPFLKKWKHWPEKPTNIFQEWEVKRIAIQEWKDFLAQFKVVKLNYDDVKIDKIMSWYDSVRAPFREGKKRKEFPDAFAVESLAQYALKQQIYIAVVSEDQDFKAACEHFTSLLYFPSLPKLVEKLLSQEIDLAPIRNSMLNKSDLLNEAVTDSAQEMSFYTNDSDVDLDESEIEDVELRDVQIVGVGDSECTIVFEASLKVRHKFSWREWGGPDGDEYYIEHDSTREESDISGTAKIQIDKDGRQALAVSFIELDQDELPADAPYIQRYRHY
ncbi:PIN domain-containing protein [Geothrix paludis]|uniref:PIN domain-containing protein n=1 Tax=Geothrix paludis TaxID=2922722 RepID=UPI002435310E|nr:PIN domain-containing protein [Geothrix paludis]